MNDDQPENPQRLSQGTESKLVSHNAHTHVHMLDQMMEPEKRLFILD